GLLLAIADCNFSYTETVTILDTGATSPGRYSAGSETDLLVGGYVGGGLSYAVTDRISVMCGAQYQAAGDTTTATATRVGQAFTKKQPVPDVGKPLLLTFGIGYSF